MAKFKFKLKKSWKSIVSMTLAGLAIFGAIFGLVALSKKVSADTKEIHPTFNVGAIDSQGNYMDSETSIYTKNLFECQGLTIEPDFEATGTFSVYYYAEDKTFIGATGNMNASDGVYVKGNDFVIAQYARIVIAPADDDQIRFYEVAGYADDYTITVNKKQKPLIKVFDDMENCAVIIGPGVWSNQENIFLDRPESPWYFAEPLNTLNANTMILKLKTSTLSNRVIYADNEYDALKFYNGVDGTEVSFNYKTALQIDDFSYIYIDVTDYTSVICAVDVQSVDVLEIFVV